MYTTPCIVNLSLVAPYLRSSKGLGTDKKERDRCRVDIVSSSSAGAGTGAGEDNINLHSLYKNKKDREIDGTGEIWNFEFLYSLVYSSNYSFSCFCAIVSFCWLCGVGNTRVHNVLR